MGTEELWIKERGQGNPTEFEIGAAWGAGAVKRSLLHPVKKTGHRGGETMLSSNMSQEKQWSYQTHTGGVGRRVDRRPKKKKTPRPENTPRVLGGISSPSPRMFCTT